MRIRLSSILSLTMSMAVCMAAVYLPNLARGNSQVNQTLMDGATLSKYIDPLPHFAGTRVDGTKQLTVSMEEFQQHVLPSNFTYPSPFKGTYVWGYKTKVKDQSGNVIATYGPLYPTYTIDAKRGVPTKVTYVNNLWSANGGPPFLQKYLTIDQTLHWANPLMTDMDSTAAMSPYSGPAPAVVHLHGAEVPSDYDGGPNQWFTHSGLRGTGYRTSAVAAPNAASYIYPNAQEGTTLWFHDHTLGGTRLNVLAGLAGFYLLRDWQDSQTNPNGTERPDLPGGPKDSTVVDNSDPAHAKTIKPEIELVIQDRLFDTNGQLFFPDMGINPDHPFWIPEFFGDVILVNGKPWPFLNVEPRRYRFRFLDGSNARFYRMWLTNQAKGKPGPAFYQIGSDGGMLDNPVRLDPADRFSPRYLFMAPGERADIILDFSKFAGQTLTLRNNAAAPFPDGDPADPSTTGQIMQFRVGTTVTGNGGSDPSFDPASGQALRKPMDRLNPYGATVVRELTLNEIEGNGGPEEVFVNNSKWNGRRPDGNPIPGAVPNATGDFMTELPKVGSTEVWEIINTTADAHPIHLHLVQFQLINRQEFDETAYGVAYEAAFPGLDMPMGPDVPAGVFIPGYGPPKPYNQLNADGAVGGNPGVARYLLGSPIPPEPNETGWKDTMIMYPGEVTRIVVRMAQQDGTPFPFDPTSRARTSLDGNGRSATPPGYVWHCHIVDHEDNEMMRPYMPVPK